MVQSGPGYFFLLHTVERCVQGSVAFQRLIKQSLTDPSINPEAEARKGHEDFRPVDRKGSRLNERFRVVLRYLGFRHPVKAHGNCKHIYPLFTGGKILVHFSTEPD